MSRVHDHDAVLDLWADGRTTYEIAARLHIASSATVSGIIRHARLKRADPRALSRVPGPTVRHLGYLPTGLIPLANREARVRGISTSQMCIRILEAVFRDGLIHAVLDDAPELSSPAKNSPSIDANRDEHSKHLLPCPRKSTKEFAGVQNVFADQASKVAGASNV